MGTVVATILLRSGSASISSLPVYPNATNISTTKVLPLLGPSMLIFATPSVDLLTFETSDSPQLVQTYYSNWFTSHGWTTLAPYSNSTTTFSSDGMPEVGKAQIYWNPGSIFPEVHIPQHHYLSDVTIDHSGQNTGVHVSLSDTFP
jgi:hypothetical protein